MKRLALLAILLCAALPVFGDSITFSTVAIQDNPFTLVPLGPGLNPIVIPQVTSVGELLVFETLTGPIGTVVFSSTLILPGLQSTLGPFTIQCDFAEKCGPLYSFQVPLSYKVIPGTLSVTLNGVTETYDFRYQSTAPEPTSLLLLGTGLAGIAWRKYKAVRH